MLLFVYTSVYVYTNVAHKIVFYKDNNS